LLAFVPAEIDVGNVDVPVLLGTDRLVISGSLERWIGIISIHESGFAEHAVDTWGTSADEFVPRARVVDQLVTGIVGTQAPLRFPLNGLA